MTSGKIGPANTGAGAGWSETTDVVRRVSAEEVLRPTGVIRERMKVEGKQDVCVRM